jgi:hypothetical protein
MRRRLRRAAAPLAALGLAACASSGARAPGEPAPAFTRQWGPYTPEDLNRDVIECADAARRELAEDAARWLEPGDVLRSSLHARTSACMEQRGWVQIRGAG